MVFIVPNTFLDDISKVILQEFSGTYFFLSFDVEGETIHAGE